MDVAVTRWLVGHDGLAAVVAATEHLDAGADALAVGTRLRHDGLDAARAAATVQVAEARRRARHRWYDADRLLFTRSALEQASDPAVSAWRAERFPQHGPIDDRAAGCGGDTLSLAGRGASVTATDVDEARLLLLAHNAAARDLEVRTTVADACVRPPPPAGPVHADPARRIGDRRVRRLRDHRPSVPDLLAHLAPVVGGAGVAVVVGPGVGLDDPALPGDAELEFVQVGARLVEAVLWTGALRGNGASATATLIGDAAVGATGSTDVVTLTRRERGPKLPVGGIGDVLLDPAPAAVRARLHDQLGAEVGARRLATRRALLTVDGDAPVSPWWQARAVEAVLAPRAAAVRRHLRRVDELPVEVALHGMDLDAARFRQQLGDVPRGPGGRRVEVVRLDEGAAAIVTVPTESVT